MITDKTLDPRLWSEPGFTQRMTDEVWRMILLNGWDHTVHNEEPAKLTGTDIGFGVVEVSFR